jgi:alkanesulfonate monooxygenase SsuD/methylene tetrahydromethanopterin reductase-like flavin-dependent oxidoreductase (luciferase family)
MDIGLQMVFTKYGCDVSVSDQQVWDEELRIAEIAVDSGFDCLWAVEHHFRDYSFCPDNLQLMAYLTAKYPNIDVGTAAIILPWQDPLRVAEKAAVLDHLSGGRMRLGMGRGLARREFEGFRTTMNESRERFDEAAALIVDALRTGWMEGDGKHYKQPRVELRPRPRFPLDERIYAVASSEDSVVSAAKIGARMVMFADRPWEKRLPQIKQHAQLFVELHGRPGPPPLTADFCVCSPTMDGAEELSRQYMGTFVYSNYDHYELLGEHFSQIKGYDSYAAKVEVAKEVGIEGMVDGFMQAAVWGTPDRILREFEKRRETIGEFELATSFRFGGIPPELAEESIKLFAKEVLPVLKTWKDTVSMKAAE